VIRHQRFGLQVPVENCSIAELREVWRLADDAGFDHLWVSDHFLPTGGASPVDTVWEAWMLLAALATATRRIRVGTLVTGNTYRHPGVLAKMAVTLDHLADGRLEFGIGTGWAEREHRMLGIDFPSARDRVGQLDEACSVLELLWTQQRVDFEGKHYRLTEAIAEPKPLQHPHPPIWIGGNGTRMLAVVARHADVWSLPTKAFGGATDLPDRVDVARQRSQALDECCHAIGRDPMTIRRAVNIELDTDPLGRPLEEAEAFRDAGFNELLLTVCDPNMKAGVVAAEQLLAKLRS